MTKPIITQQKTESFPVNLLSQHPLTHPGRNQIMQPILNVLNIKDLSGHPSNPRISLREDVITGIIAGLNDGFKNKHAIHVRPIDDGYQIISGHHRVEAANRANITEIPCWVEEMDDETAYMELVKSNAQGELTSLEIGLHALHAVGKAQGKKGEGLEFYASEIGRSRPNICQWVDAARVYESLSNTSYEVQEKISHLYEISKADPGAWPFLVDRLIKEQWTVNDCKHWVGRVKEFDAKPHDWDFFLPYDGIIERFLRTKEFAALTIKKIIIQCNRALEKLDPLPDSSPEHELYCASLVGDFVCWLIENQGTASWDVRKVAEESRRLEVLAFEFVEKTNDSFLNCDWRDLPLEDNSIALLLTDPPYGIKYQSDRRKDRRKDRKHKLLSKDETIEEACNELQDCLEFYFPKLKEDAHIFVFCNWKNEFDFRFVIESCGFKVRGSLIWDKQHIGTGDPNTTFAPEHERIIHAVKGSLVLFEREGDVLSFPRVDSKLHPTQKPVDLLKMLIEPTTVEGELVSDPFSGVASTYVACKELKRNFIGSEIEKDFFDKGMARCKDSVLK
jgi:ParB/RepB/Spo0J family partition protein